MNAPIDSRQQHLLERSERGGLICPFADIHVDMHLRLAA